MSHANVQFCTLYVNKQSCFEILKFPNCPSLVSHANVEFCTHHFPGLTWAKGFFCHKDYFSQWPFDILGFYTQQKISPQLAKTQALSKITKWTKMFETTCALKALLGIVKGNTFAIFLYFRLWKRRSPWNKRSPRNIWQKH